MLRIEDTVASICSGLRQVLEFDGINIETGVTAGIALLGPDGDEAERLLQYADVAKFEAKSKKRGSWCFFSQTMTERAIESLRIESALKKSLAGEEFRLHYQPIVDATSGQVEACCAGRAHLWIGECLPGAVHPGCRTFRTHHRHWCVDCR